MSECYQISSFLQETESVNRLQFLQWYNHPVLLRIVTEHGELLAIDEQASVVARKVRRVTQENVKTSLETAAFVLPDRRPIFAHFFFIKNSDANAQRSFIGIGTDPSCDLSFPNTTLSQRHGFFKSSSDANFTDAGSKGGTFINNTRLSPRVAKTLQNHDVIRLGEESFIFMSVHGFYEFLKACSLALSTE
jgi:hypothetical protein